MAGIRFGAATSGTLPLAEGARGEGRFLSSEIRIRQLSRLLGESRETKLYRDTSEFKDDLERWARTGIACAIDHVGPTEKAEQSRKEALVLAKALLEDRTAGNDPRVLFDICALLDGHLSCLPDAEKPHYYPRERELVRSMETRLLVLFRQRLASER